MMEKQRSLMLLAAKVAIFAFTGVSSQAIIITDWSDFTSTGNLPGSYNMEQDWAVTQGSPDITISASNVVAGAPDYLSYQLFEGDFGAFSPGDRVSIEWDGGPRDGGVYDEIGLRFGYSEAQILVLWIAPYQQTINSYTNDPAGQLYGASGISYTNAPDALYIEKLTASTWELGYVEAGVDIPMASVTSSWAGGRMGIWSKMQNRNGVLNLTNFNVPFMPTVPEPATNPSPSDGAAYALPDNGLLNWTAGRYALSHDVYFGTDETAVANAQRLGGDINGDGPVNLLDLAVLAAQWLSTPGAVNPSADIVFSGQVDIDDLLAVAADWGTPPDAAFKGNQTSTTYPGLLDLNTTYYWRIDEINASNVDSPWVGTVWSFTTVPLTASSPSPPNEEINIWKDVNLNWTAGANATSHDVYFGTDSTPDSDPGSSEFKGNQPGTTYTIGSGVLADNTTYYWRIDEVNDYGTATGAVWSFTTETGSRLAPEDFAILAWDGPGTGRYGRPTLDSMRACGFNVAGFAPAQYFDVIADAGLKAFLLDWDCYATTQDLVWLDPAEIALRVASAVSSVNDHPALFGYLLEDEPPASDFPGLANWVDAFHAADPSHPAYISLGWPYDWTSYLNDVSAEFLSYDFYGMMLDGTVHSYYFPVLESARDASISSGLPFWNTVESIKETSPSNPEFNTARPSPETLRFQAYTSLAYGVKGIAWFTYFSSQVDWPAPVVNGVKTDIWDYLKDVNMQVHRIGPTYITLTNTGVFHHPNVPPSQPFQAGTCRGISSSNYVDTISGGDYVVSEFTGPSSTKCLMVVNKSLTSNANINITFKTSTGTIKYVDPITGQLQNFTQGQTLLPGAGLLMKLD